MWLRRKANPGPQLMELVSFSDSQRFREDQQFAGEIFKSSLPDHFSTTSCAKTFLGCAPLSRCICLAAGQYWRVQTTVIPHALRDFATLMHQPVLQCRRVILEVI